MMSILPSQHRRVLAFDLSPSYLQAVYGEAGPAGFKVLACAGQRVLASERSAPEVPERFLEQFLRENAISARQAVLSISDPRAVHIQYLVLPAMPEEEISAAAKWKIKDEVPFVMEGAFSDWRTVREFVDEEGARKIGVIVVVLEKGAADRGMALLKRFQLETERITTSFLGYAALMRRSAPAPAAILDIGHDNSRLGIYTQNELNLVRTLPFALERVVASLTGVLGSERGKVALSHEEAERVLNEHGILADEHALMKDHIQASHVISLMRPLLESLHREVRFSFDYFASVLDSDKPQLVYAVGPGARLKGLGQFLKKELGIEAEPFPLPPAVQVRGRKDNASDIQDALGALGAALADGKDMDLLPLEIKNQQTVRLQNMSFRLTAMTMTLVMAVGLFFSELRVSDYQRRVRNARRHLENAEKLLAIRQEALADRIYEGAFVPEGIMKALGALIPEGIILDEVSVMKSNATATLKGRVTLQGPDSDSAVTGFMEKLENSPFFNEASMSFSQVVDSQNLFEIQCRLAN